MNVEPRLAHGVGSGGSSILHACRVGEIYGSDVFQRWLDALSQHVLEFVF